MRATVKVLAIDTSENPRLAAAVAHLALEGHQTVTPTPGSALDARSSTSTPTWSCSGR
jgi:hypothetical protein